MAKLLNIRKKRPLVRTTEPFWMPDDPIYRFVSRLSVSGVWFAVALFNTIVYLIVGFSIDYLYPNATNLLGIRDRAEIINGINVSIVFIPMIWAYYRWLPEAVGKYIRQIEEMEVIGPAGQGSSKKLSELLAARINTWWFHLVAVVASGISCLYMLLVFIPAQHRSIGLIDFWYYTPLSNIIFFMGYVSVNYALFVFLLRVVAVVVTIDRTFREPDRIKNLYPLHPDKCGGIGNIGLLTSRMTLIMVIFPIWITTVALFAMLAGGQMLAMEVLLVYILYAILVPFILASLLWQPHMAMVAYKNKQMTEIARKLKKVEEQLNGMTENNLEQMKRHVEYYKHLQEMQATLEKQIPIWPISLPVLRSFGTIASSPVIIGLLSFGTNLLIGYIEKLILNT
jgi:ABC-type multidrug transport system fused ATPase/permease subunit